MSDKMLPDSSIESETRRQSKDTSDLTTPENIRGEIKTWNETNVEENEDREKAAKGRNSRSSFRPKRRKVYDREVERRCRERGQVKKTFRTKHDAMRGISRQYYETTDSGGSEKQQETDDTELSYTSDSGSSTDYENGEGNAGPSHSGKAKSARRRHHKNNGRPKYDDYGYAGKRGPYHGERLRRGSGKYQQYSDDLHYEMFGQLLHKQDLLLMKLESVVDHLKRVVKVVGRQHARESHSSPGGSHFNDSEVMSSYRGERERQKMCEAERRRHKSRSLSISDREVRNRDGHSHGEIRRKRKSTSSRNEQDQIRIPSGFAQDLQSECSSRNEDSQQKVPRRAEQDSTDTNPAEIGPIISSYYSVRPPSTDGIQQPSDNDDKSGIILTPNHIPNKSGDYHSGEITAGSDVMQQGSILSGDVFLSPSKECHSSTPQKAEKISMPSNNRLQETTKGTAVEEQDMIAAVPVTIEVLRPRPIQHKRALSREERPSMVDLSSSGDMMTQPRYVALRGGRYPSPSAFLPPAEINAGSEIIPLVMPAQPWQENESMPHFPTQYTVNQTHRSRRDSNEHTPWLARTFTTEHNHDGGASRNQTTDGRKPHDAVHQSNSRQSRNANEKKKTMMSSIAHLINSSIDVSSETVQILIATPSDHQKGDRDPMSKSMEKLLNQSLAIMSCLPLIAEIDLSVVQKIYQGSKNCMTFIYRLMDHCYTREELTKCRVAGGVRKYRGNNTETEQLCPKRLRTILKLANDLYPSEYLQLSRANMIRNNINMKCRKTVIRDVSDNIVA